MGPLGKASGSRVRPLVREGGLPGPRPPGGPVRNGSYLGKLHSRNCTSAYSSEEMHRELVVQPWAASPFAPVNVQLKNMQFSVRRCARSGLEASTFWGWRAVCGQRGGKARVSACPAAGHTGQESQRALTQGCRCGRGGGGCLLFASSVWPAPGPLPARPARPEQACTPSKTSPAVIHSAASCVRAGGADCSCPLTPWRLIGVPAQAG